MFKRLLVDIYNLALIIRLLHCFAIPFCIVSVLYVNQHPDSDGKLMERRCAERIWPTTLGKQNLCSCLTGRWSHKGHRQCLSGESLCQSVCLVFLDMMCLLTETRRALFRPCMVIIASQLSYGKAQATRLGRATRSPTTRSIH